VRRRRRYAAVVEPPRAVIVSEDPLARSGLAALLAGRPDIAVVGGVAPGAPRLPDELAALDADVALWEAGPGEGALPRELAALPVVALVSGEAQAAEALAGGARAVLFRDADGDRIAAALGAAARGLVALEGALAGWLRPPAVAPGEAEGLTPRESEVLALLAEGLPNKVIAQRLGISERTAKFHVESILGKLGAESRSEAIVIAARRGMVTL
jgi:two-component system, NarL family, nitrate/nitrite response regulator NarL